MTDRDAICRALYDAIGWQRGLADAYSHMEDAPERQQALEMARRYRAILRKRYKVKETADERMDGSATINIEDVGRARSVPGGVGGL